MSTEPDETVPVPTNAEDAKRFKAMASVESNTTTSDDDPTTTTADVDQEALGKAMADLSGPAAMNTTVKAGPALKVNQEDVALIVEEMEVTKVKATELLRANGGSVSETLKLMVSP